MKEMVKRINSLRVLIAAELAFQNIDKKIRTPPFTPIKVKGDFKKSKLIFTNENFDI